MNTDLLAAAITQMATLMAATWTLTETIGAKFRLGKLWIAQGVGAALSSIAYGLGWFNALPAATASAIPIAGFRGYLSAAFAGSIAAVVTSLAHKVLIGARTSP